MCVDCYESYLDEDPALNEPTAAARAAAILVLNLYEHASAGGAGHIVFDDWNIEDQFVGWCIAEPLRKQEPSEERAACEAALNAFTGLTLAERNAALALVWLGEVPAPDAP